MSLAYFGAGVMIGFIFGVGAVLLYVRWKIKRQLGAMQTQMEGAMNIASDMDVEEGLSSLENSKKEEN